MASNGVARRGRVAVLLGAQWGDEGKGKIIDYLIDHDKVREILVIWYFSEIGCVLYSAFCLW